jgi:hypothetical protein
VRASKEERLRPRWSLRRVGRCSKKDVLDAFRIVGYEIRTRLKQFSAEVNLTQAEACRLALRIRDQRELARQMATKRDSKHLRRLLRLNKRYRRRLIELCHKPGLDTTILVFR